LGDAAAAAPAAVEGGGGAAGEDGDFLSALFANFETVIKKFETSFMYSFLGFLNQKKQNILETNAAEQKVLH
jgi:hypothetical protein